VNDFGQAMRGKVGARSFRQLAILSTATKVFSMKPSEERRLWDGR
jgi:hypothetical protein